MMTRQADSTVNLRLGSPLANRFRLHYETSRHLHEYRFGVEISCQQLAHLLERATLLRLYQHNFPAEYAASQADDHYAFDRHSEKELEFFEHLPKLFPFPEALDEDELLYGIPILPLGYDHWNLSAEDYSTGGLAIATLLGHQADERWDTREALPARQISPERLDELCLEYSPDHPLRSLGLLLRALDFQSGNPFLDTCAESPSEEWEWTQESIDELTKAGQHIERVQQCDRALSDWLEADPQHYVELLELWNRADYASAPMLLDTPRSPAITTITAQEWVAGRT